MRGASNHDYASMEREVQARAKIVGYARTLYENDRARNRNMPAWTEAHTQARKEYVREAQRDFAAAHVSC